MATIDWTIIIAKYKISFCPFTTSLLDKYSLDGCTALRSYISPRTTTSNIIAVMFANNICQTVITANLVKVSIIYEY